MSEVRENCHRLFERLQRVATKCGRDAASIRLIAVTKTVPVDRIREVVEFGVADIGENRLQEALSKRKQLQDLPARWHFIGHLQSNKARKVIEHFDWLQSVDRMDLARKLNEYASRRFPVLIEVNLGEEPAKSGVPISDAQKLTDDVHRLERLDLRGLMAIPPFSENPEDSRPYFRRLREMAERLRLPEVSMGMSHDFEIAIEEGATMVRIGTALFGTRR
jgi:pyridoxal phosphate enzyme (YggS family)